MDLFLILIQICRCFVSQEMTLEQYQKVKEDKRKRLLAMKTEERKVELDKELKCMHQLSNNRKCHDIFIKLVN